MPENATTAKNPGNRKPSLPVSKIRNPVELGKRSDLLLGPVRGGGEVSLNELLAEFPGQLLSAGAIGSRSAFALPARNHCSKRGGRQNNT